MVKILELSIDYGEIIILFMYFVSQNRNNTDDFALQSSYRECIRRVNSQAFRPKGFADRLRFPRSSKFSDHGHCVE